MNSKILSVFQLGWIGAEEAVFIEHMVFLVYILQMFFEFAEWLAFYSKGESNSY